MIMIIVQQSGCECIFWCSKSVGVISMDNS